MAIDHNAQHPAGAASLSKITLSKAAPTVSLAKTGEPQGAMRVNLNWSAGTSRPKKGFFARLTGPPVTAGIDLDLGCLYELSDGSKGVVQALGNSYGSLETQPYIRLDADDRTGTSVGGENMHINLARPEMFRRILVFAMIYEGAQNWSAVDGIVTLYPTFGPPVEVRLDSPNNDAPICAIALLQNAGREITVTREVRYINGGQSDLDRAYGWGMQWTAGRK